MIFQGSVCVFSTPASGAGAIAVLQLHGDVDVAFASMGIESVAPGQVRLRDLCGVDRGVVARWGAGCAHLYPHGGRAVLSALHRAIASAGVPVVESSGIGVPPPEDMYPEAADAFEALVLTAVARCPSPLGIDLLLDQPRRWRSWDGVSPGPAAVDAKSTALCRLLDPPLVVAVGPSNVGKSALLNALAGRGVSVVADEPGATRDHVGASLELSGLAVRWVDAPGFREAADPTEHAAIATALCLLPAASLIVCCSDAVSDHSVVAASLPPGVPVLRVGLRVDAYGPVQGAAVQTAAAPQQGVPVGLDALAAAVRAHLVPDSSLCWPGPWRFAPALAVRPGV